MDEAEEYIDFMAKYKNWISIKRLGIRESTKPEEVVQHLAGIRATIDSKSYPMLGIRTSILDEHASKLCQGARKNYNSLSEVLGRMNSPGTKKIISDSCSKELSSIAETYLLGKVITSLGFDTSINQLQMSRIFPDLKPPKALGRGKSKKTEE